jgi:hypothetical protein
MPTRLLRLAHRALVCIACGAVSIPALAAEPEFSLVISGHRFEPGELRIPANTRVKLTIQNQDATPEEFESHALNREKLIPAGSKAAIYIGPLKPGRYEYFGEFNPTSAKGVIISE